MQNDNCKKKYALIGGDVGHSFSKELHAKFANYKYDLISASEENEIKKCLEDNSYSGFNVTVPYKETVIKYLDELSETAKMTQAVNTILRKTDGKLKGFNTDVFGFKKMLSNVRVENKCILVLGTGGAASAACCGLKEMNAKTIIAVSRNPERKRKPASSDLLISYDEVMKVQEERGVSIVINATPIGMYPDINQSVLRQNGIRLDEFSNLKAVVDLIYNPYRSRLLLDGEDAGAEVLSGLSMLVYQALKANEIWLKNERSEKERDEIARSVIRDILGKQLNITVIGMPGSGKSAISRQLAIILDKKFIDIDREITSEEGMTPAEIISDSSKGESVFRELEVLATEKACKGNGAVIATGGGAVQRKINRDHIRQNSIAVYIKSPTTLLAVKNRPMSSKLGIKEIYKKRRRFYSNLANVTIENKIKFGSTFDKNGNKNSYRYDMKRFVYRMKRVIERYLDEISDC